ncbi:unnamed protein product [Vitrella brassicaformis CCMP3155]|uniref:Major facilitator superfamily (MFS) profile domain-containing protein n=2 Tax=Vitrella brassicaformis TaxID=1169539 RepID=A0A0G4F566_VITBC|nr:unnamed protein product [Vitrella brassicaformis CCMP3155]|eukprot:CEM06978.1 unnamed protein product [Vitrella brassicaformis CCMP3155]
MENFEPAVTWSPPSRSQTSADEVPSAAAAPAAARPTEDSPLRANTTTGQFGRLMRCPRELWFVYAMKMGESFAYFSMSFILVLFLSEEYGFSDREAGWIYGVFGLLSSLVGLCVGSAVDNLGVRASLVLGSTILTVSRVLLCLTYSSHITVAVLLVGLPVGASLGIPLLSHGVRRYTSEPTRALAFSIFYVIMNLAAFLGGVTSNIIRHQYKKGLDLHIGNAVFHLTTYRILLSVGTCLSVVNMSLACCIREIVVVRHDAQPEEFKTRRASPVQITYEVLTQARFWRYCGLAAIFVGCRMNLRHMDATLPKYLTRMHGPDAPYDLIISLNPMLIVGLVPLATVFAEHIQWPITHFLQIGCFLSSVCPFALAVSTSYTAAVCSIVVLSLGEAMWSPKLYEYSVTVAPEGREGTFIALDTAPVFLSKLATGGISGTMLERFVPRDDPERRNPLLMWAIIGCLSMISPILLWSLHHIIFRIEDYRGSGSQRAIVHQQHASKGPADEAAGASQ